MAVLELGGSEMKFEDIKFNKTDLPQGIQAMIHFGVYDLSIVKSDFSYGGSSGLYEIAVFDGDVQTELPGITDEGDTVKGYLTEADVGAIIKKMYLITGKTPVQI